MKMISTKVYFYQMKKLPPFVLVALLMTGFSSYSQYFEPVKKPTYTYMGLGTGLNSQVGFIGVTLESPKLDKFTFFGGMGIGTWGYKFSAGAKRFLRDTDRWAFSTSLGYAMGFPELLFTELDPIFLIGHSEPADVMVDLYGAAILNFSLVRHFYVGREKINRILFEFGYSIRLSHRPWKITNGYEFSREGNSLMRILQPGGIIIGLGYQFYI